MESVLNRLKSTVTNAASSAVSNAFTIANQVSNYLPGNPVTREYEATAQIASAGRGLTWKIFEGFKKSTKEEAAIFLFEKRQLEKLEKSEREIILDKIRKGVSQLTRIRHPQILTVQHPLEESRETLAFATEPCFSSLSNVLGNHENLPTLPSHLINFTLYDLEIKYGLYQLWEGLNFIHSSLKIVHRCITPENVIINKQGVWKIWGFEFCSFSSDVSTTEKPKWEFISHETRKHPLSQANLDYMGPEYATTKVIDPSTDMFSLGVLIYSIFNQGEPVIRHHDDFFNFERSCANKTVSNCSLKNVPLSLKDSVKSLLNSNAEMRMDSVAFLKIPYFNDISVKTLLYLDQSFQRDNMERSKFYKNLPQILSTFPQRILLLRIIPSLNKECMNPTMIPFVLPIMLHVSEIVSKEDFVLHILPHLKPIMKITEPIQIMLLLMMKMDLLLTKTPPDDIRTDTLPLLYRALECNTQQIQELCLSVLPTCAPLVDSPTMKNSILPRIKKLCLATSFLSVRVNSLICVGKLVENLDKWLIIDDIFPFLFETPSKEAPVIMAMVGIFKIVFTHKKLGISKEILANKVLPFLIPLSIENSLSCVQYSTIMSFIRNMLGAVEGEHKSKLQHLDSIKSEQKSLELSMPDVVSNGTALSLENSDTSVKTDDFSSLFSPNFTSTKYTTNNFDFNKNINESDFKSSISNTDSNKNGNELFGVQASSSGGISKLSVSKPVNNPAFIPGFSSTPIPRPSSKSDTTSLLNKNLANLSQTGSGSVSGGSRIMSSSQILPIGSVSDSSGTGPQGRVLSPPQSVPVNQTWSWNTFQSGPSPKATTNPNQNILNSGQSYLVQPVATMNISGHKIQTQSSVSTQQSSVFGMGNQLSSSMGFQKPAPVSQTLGLSGLHQPLIPAPNQDSSYKPLSSNDIDSFLK